VLVEEEEWGLNCPETTPTTSTIAMTATVMGIITRRLDMDPAFYFEIRDKKRSTLIKGCISTLEAMAGLLPLFCTILRII
jgi:hypothetical protein